MAADWTVDEPPPLSPRAGVNNLGAPLSSEKTKKFNIRQARVLQAKGWSHSRIAEFSGNSVQFVTARMRQPKSAFTGGYGSGLLTVGSPDRLLEGLFREHAKGART